VSDVEIEVLDNPAGELARLLVEAARAGRSIGLSGGSTPRRAYELAATQEPDWSRAELWLVDDRCVPPTDDRSNARIVRETILDRLERAPRAVHRIQGELEPEEAAARYDAELDGARFDVAVMGVGPDGHTASLFPGGPELAERKRRAVAAEAGMEPFVPRVTTTIPFLAETGLMVYLITGADKADAVRRAFAQEPSADVPASLVRGRSTVVLLDADAASGLHSSLQIPI
jgi:6-phosphogluconolactonase